MSWQITTTPSVKFYIFFPSVLSDIVVRFKGHMTTFASLTISVIPLRRRMILRSLSSSHSRVCVCACFSNHDPTHHDFFSMEARVTGGRSPTNHKRAYSLEYIPVEEEARQLVRRLEILRGKHPVRLRLDCYYVLHCRRVHWLFASPYHCWYWIYSFTLLHSRQSQGPF
jgi:hypothetical protein